MRLEVIVDEWSEERQAFNSACDHAVKVTAAETFEWMPGELFLLHNLDGAVGETDVFLHRQEAGAVDRSRR
jgi:hypothetical protein